MNTNIEIDNSFLLSAEEWFKKSTVAILSMLNVNNKTFIRNTENEGYKNDFYTSATLHSIIALCNSGCFNSNDLYKDGVISTPYFKLESKKYISPDDIIKRITEYKVIKNVPTTWAENIIDHSSHSKKENGKPVLREIIVLDLLLNSLNSIFEVNNDLNDKRETYIKQDALDFIKSLLDILLAQLFEEKEEEAYLYAPGKTPAPLIHAILCILMYNKLKPKIESGAYEKELAYLLSQVDSHIDFHMARCSTTSVSLFDPVSLASSLYAKTIVQPEFRLESFFLSCLKTVMSCQHNNGCWPDGISLTFSSTGDVVQQPSVGVALSIAEAAIDKSFLIDYNENIEQILTTVLPGLRKTAKYLIETYEIKITTPKDGSIGSISGWSSDRIRRTKYTEAWITSLTNRFFYRLWIAEMAMLRFQSFKKLGVKYFKSRFSDGQKIDQVYWEDKIIEPDDIVKPAYTVWTKYISPIIAQKNSSSVIHSPKKNCVSFIIFGPPGSGKTFFINNIAKILDWPLVELGPGHFIKNGLELIESTAKDLFDTLDNICHAVVFFDECDELFRKRTIDKASASRSILSFATASMLPKLQKLHDDKKIIFVLGTNYLESVDSAIRRPGRFDDTLLFDRPDDKARLHYLTKAIKGMSEAEKADKKLKESMLDKVVASSNFYTFQELSLIVDSGADAEIENSVNDYKDWCKNEGEQELKASRIDINKIPLILKKWGVPPIN